MATPQEALKNSSIYCEKTIFISWQMSELGLIPSATLNSTEIASKRINLKKRGIRYEWLGKELGGFRKKGLGEKSPNKAWKSQSFRNYADHTMTEDFRKGITKLLELAQQSTVAFMCAEQYYRSCHRQIISDYLKVQGRGVTHIIGKGKTEEHELTSFSKIVDGELTYPKKNLR